MFTKLLNLFKSNTAVKGTLIVTIGLFIANFLAYVLQLVLGRILSVEEYGVFNALISILTIVGFANTVFSTSLVKFASELKAKVRYDALTALFWRFTAIAFLTGILLLLSFFSFRNLLGSYLNITDSTLFVLLGLYTLASLANTVPVSYLQGLLRFKAFSFVTVVGAIFRLALPLLLVVAGWQVRGVITGMSVALFISFIVGIMLLKKNFDSYEASDYSAYYKQFIKFSGPVILANLGMLLLSNLDLLLVKHFFSATDAGLYSGVVILGKILLFGAGTVAIVMYPQITELFALKKDYKGKLNEFLFIQVLILFVGAVAFGFFPSMITHLMFGEKFIQSAAYLPLYTIFISIYVLLNFMNMVFLAINKTVMFFLYLPALLLQYLLINSFHTTLFEVIKINIIVSLSLLFFVVLYYLYHAHFNSSSSL